jgi:predicted dehydrogenase
VSIDHGEEERYIVTRIALLGAGMMGATHARAYATIPDAEVVAIFSREAEIAAPLGDLLGAPVYTDLDRLWQETAPEAVDCCLPTFLHRSAVEAAALHRCQVICEKPLALTLEDGRAMLDACRAAGVRLLVAQVVRFFPAYRALAEALRDGSAGTPVTVSLLRQAFFPLGEDGWYRDPSQSGGIFLDLMIHDIDWALRQFGPVERVYAREAHSSSRSPFAQGMATLRHRSGTLTQLTVTWGHPGPFTTAVEISGTGGLLRYHSADSESLRVLVPQTAVSQGSVPLPDVSTGEDPYRTELAHFVEVLEGRAEPLVRPEEALAALQVALLARESAETGRAYTVAEEVAA